MKEKYIPALLLHEKHFKAVFNFISLSVCMGVCETHREREDQREGWAGMSLWASTQVLPSGELSLHHCCITYDLRDFQLVTSSQFNKMGIMTMQT